MISVTNAFFLFFCLVEWRPNYEGMFMYEWSVRMIDGLLACLFVNCHGIQFTCVPETAPPMRLELFVCWCCNSPLKCLVSRMEGCSGGCLYNYVLGEHWSLKCQVFSNGKMFRRLFGWLCGIVLGRLTSRPTVCVVACLIVCVTVRLNKCMSCLKISDIRDVFVNRLIDRLCA